MTKRTVLYFIVLAAVAASCSKKDKTVFSESPDQRINQVLTAYQDTMANAPYGWRGLVFPSGLKGGVVSFYFKFNQSNRVQMFSDFDSISNVTMMESSYRLKALQQPALIFDTYCYVTVLCDPDASVNGGSYGLGLSSDFEFAIDTVTTDTIKLTGRLHGSKAILVKATQQEMSDYYGQKHSNRFFDNLNKYLTYFKRITVNGVIYEVQPDLGNRTVTITWIDSNGNTHTDVTGYYYTTTGIGFIIPVVNGSTVISGFDNIAWNGSNLSMTLTVNGANITVAQAAVPLSPDLTAATRWWQAANTGTDYWISQQGFHVNGVDDAFGITGIAGFYYLAYNPNYGGSGYDAVEFYDLINDTLTTRDYLPAFNAPTTFSNGKSTFKFLGTFGTMLAPADSLPIAKTITQFTDSQGYYFVQLDSLTYDMVGARDGKAWIHWQFY